MKIYTKTGDEGKTGLISGTRVFKSDIRIEAYGTVDELNSWLGLLGELPEAHEQKNVVDQIQHHLFNIGSQLAAEKPQAYLPDIREEDIHLLEKNIDEMDSCLQPLKNFILPGGHRSVAYVHIARTVCRRAERGVVALQQEQAVAPVLVMYLNRLSDYLFVLARFVAMKLGVEEKLWKK